MVSFNIDSVTGGQDWSFLQVVEKCPDRDLPEIFRKRIGHELSALHAREPLTQRQVIAGMKERLQAYEKNLAEAEKFLDEDGPKSELEFIEPELRAEFKAGNFDNFDSMLEGLRSKGVKAKHINQFLSSILYEGLPADISNQDLKQLINYVRDENSAKVYFALPRDVKGEDFFRNIIASEKNIGREAVDLILGRVEPQVYKNMFYELVSKKTNGLSQEELINDRKLLDRLLPIIGNNEEIMGMTYAAFAVNGSRNTLLVELIERFAPDKVIKNMPIEPGTSY
jgi:hypothetical protein